MARPDSPVVAAEIREAVDAGRAVVALESTIITHGLPRPRNLDVAHEAEALLREAGVVPATVGVVDGVPTVGLSDDQIAALAADDAAEKLSIRDLPVAAAKNWTGGTTVAATALLAHRAGVAVFATGGLGGVHHGASETFDESADLTALADIPIVVVSAGAKSILDVGATLERLETLSIPVVGWRTDRYPGFYVPDSGHPVPHTVDSAAEVATMVAASDDLGLRAALLVANPVPEHAQLPAAEHDAALARAWEAAREHGITGKATTPFLLEHLLSTTGGRSLEVNVALYSNNVSVGAEIARALAL
ncbi:pseudouridine-5-phosphate glycosidase [Allosaccharopolyspora coralli]|uniref:Pseudouridine-5'-phosphate glycosidase n=1 Tax=Allosaccharopolyspora coralli TaxID=2665642 RepID=A0A5Q3Q8G1_9PSEU|nr:pseudouridine-5'-phosphate glycosidase [Allosaccharopolyspora coralli]QGK70663.1 pseudouridine-5-phosphate glycosidase [Allosaccharopolyspora coralli]